MNTPHEDAPVSPSQKVEKPYEDSFYEWANAYWHPGQDGEGSQFQWRALLKMVEKAATFDEWATVYSAASGSGWGAWFLGHMRPVTDKTLAARALAKMEELKAQATDEKIRDLLHTNRGKLMRWAMKELQVRRGESPEEKEDPEILVLPVSPGRSLRELQAAAHHLEKKQVFIPMKSRSPVAERVSETLWSYDLPGVIAILKETFGEDWRRHNLSQQTGWTIAEKTDDETSYAVIIYNYDHDYFPADKYE